MPLPEAFKDTDEFLGYCLTHSETERALFSAKQVNYLYELLGMSPPCRGNDLRRGVFAPIHSGEMRRILDVISIRRGSIEVDFEVV